MMYRVDYRTLHKVCMSAEELQSHYSRHSDKPRYYSRFGYHITGKVVLNARIFMEEDGPEIEIPKEDRTYWFTSSTDFFHPYRYENNFWAWNRKGRIDLNVYGLDDDTLEECWLNCVEPMVVPWETDSGFLEAGLNGYAFGYGLNYGLYDRELALKLARMNGVPLVSDEDMRYYSFPTRSEQWIASEENFRRLEEFTKEELHEHEAYAVVEYTKYRDGDERHHIDGVYLTRAAAERAVARNNGWQYEDREVKKSYFVERVFLYTPYTDEEVEE